MISYDICIHGAGFVGQALALLLSRLGFQVILLDSSKPRGANETEYTDIRAFALNASSKALLESVEAWPIGSAVTPVHAMHIYGDTDGMMQFESVAPEALPLNWLVDVPALATLLKGQVARDTRIVRQTTPAQAKLHIICEGKHARLREELGIELNITPYEQQAIAARLRCELPHQETARQWFNDRGEILALLPIGGEGSHDVALVWSLMATHAQELIQANEATFTHELQTACDNALGNMTLMSERGPWPLFMAKVSPWCGQTPDKVWVLAGDAAHVVHPLAGQGLNLGFGDALQLVKTLTKLQKISPSFNISHSQLLRALRQYARSRQAAIAPVAHVTDSLQLLFAHPHPAIQRIRNLGMGIFNHGHLLKKQIIKRAQ